MNGSIDLKGVWRICTVFNLECTRLLDHSDFS